MKRLTPLAMILVCVALSGTAGAATYYWDIDGANPGAGGATPSGTWNGVNTYWNDDSTGGGGGTLIASPMTGDILTFSAGAYATGSYNVTISGTGNAASLIFEDGTATVTGGTLNLAAAGVVGGNNAATATINSTITGAGTSFTKSGTGTVALGTSLPSGTLTVDGGGTLDIGSTSSSVSGIVLTNGSITGAGTVTSNGGGFDAMNLYNGSISAALAGTAPVGLYKRAGGNVTLSGLNTFTGDIYAGTAGGGTLSFHTMSNKGAPSAIGAGDATAGWGDFFINTPSHSKVTYQYTGPSVTTDRGLYAHQYQDRSGPASVGGSLGTFEITNSGVTVGLLGQSVWGSGSGGGKIFKGPGSGLSTLNFGPVRLWYTGGDGGHYYGTSSLNVNIASLLCNAGGTGQTILDFDGPSNSIGNINFTIAKNLSLWGAGTTTLTGANVYSGAMTVDNGTVILAGDNTGASGAWTITSDGILRVGSGGAAGTLSTGTISNAGQLIFNRSDTTYVAPNNISGAGSLQQLGSGKTTLSGTNTYTGPTNVTAGTLLINGNQSAATGNVTVASGATLGGAGSIGGAITIDGGGAIAPGDSIDTLTGTSVTWNSDNSQAGMVFELSTIDNTSDLLNLSGTLTKGAGASFLFDFTGGKVGETYTLVNFASSPGFAVGDFVDNLGIGGEFTLSATQLQFTIVPEPSSLILAACGLLGLLRCGRRRRR